MKFLAIFGLISLSYLVTGAVIFFYYAYAEFEDFKKSVFPNGETIFVTACLVWFFVLIWPMHIYIEFNK